MVDLVTSLAAVFITAGALLVIANHFSLSPIPFYIIAGVIAGAFLEQPEVLDLAQWGIAFLVFVFGVNIDFRALTAVFRDGEITTAVQIGVLGPLSFAAGLLLGFGMFDALYFAITATLSSTIVGSSLLQTEIRDNLIHGRLAESMHFLEDLVAIVLLLVLSANNFTLDAIAANFGYGVVLLIAAAFIHQYGFNILSHLSGGSQELMLMSSISILIGFLVFAELVGISITIGAFAAGLGIKRDVTHHIGMLNGIESIKDFFATIFFVMLGALVAVPTVASSVTVLVLVGLTVLIKPILVTVTLFWEGYDTRAAFLTGVSLDQVSEFALIIAIESFIAGVLSPELFDAIVFAATVTMITSSYTYRHGDQLYQSLFGRAVDRVRTRKIDQRSHIESSVSDHIIIVGFGRKGRQLAHYCKEHNYKYIVIENDPIMLESLEKQCQSYVFGDAIDQYAWEKAMADEAQMIISTVDDLRVSDHILDLSIAADIILQASDSDEARILLDRGAMYVFVPEIIASEQLIEHVVAVIDEPMNRETLRDEHCSNLDVFESIVLDSLQNRTEVP